MQSDAVGVDEFMLKVAFELNHGRRQGLKTNRVLNGCKRQPRSRRASSRKKSARSKEKVRRADWTGREQYLGVQTLIALFYSVFGLAWLKVLELPDRLNSLFRFLDLLNLAKANCRQ